MKAVKVYLFLALNFLSGCANKLIIPNETLYGNQHFNSSLFIVFETTIQDEFTYKKDYIVKLRVWDMTTLMP
jgi:hypothetical protein